MTTTTPEFSLDAIRNLSPNDARAYITKYFVPLTNGNIAVLREGKYVVEDDAVIKKVYFRRMSAELNKYFFQEFTGTKTPVYKLNKPEMFDDKINLCSQLPKPQDYATIGIETKGKVAMMLEYIKEVLCSNDDASYTHLIKWIATTCRGNKNDCAVVLKTEGQGVGKSTLPQFILKHVLPKKLGLETGSQPIISNFNSILGGKLFVNFEELETFSKGEWMAVSSRLKRMITSDLITLEKKGIDAYESDNINNYFILSNNTESIRDDDGRRYFILDISTHRKGKQQREEYWKPLYDKCFNDEVGRAFYSYLYTIDLTGYISQNYPDTQNKKDGIAKRLDNVFVFLKTNYTYKNQSIKSSVDDLYQEYKSFCCGNQKLLNKIDFNAKLKGIGIQYYKSSSVNKYSVSISKLKEIAKENNWLHDLDKVQPEEDEDYEDINDLKRQLKEAREIIKKLQEGGDIEDLGDLDKYI